VGVERPARHEGGDAPAPAPSMSQAARSPLLVFCHRRSACRRRRSRRAVRANDRALATAGQDAGVGGGLELDEEHEIGPRGPLPITGTAGSAWSRPGQRSGSPSESVVHACLRGPSAVAKPTVTGSVAAGSRATVNDCLGGPRGAASDHRVPDAQEGKTTKLAPLVAVPAGVVTVIGPVRASAEPWPGSRWPTSS
jgi:hypothetical protein